MSTSSSAFAAHAGGSSVPLPGGAPGVWPADASAATLPADRADVRLADPPAVTEEGTCVRRPAGNSLAGCGPVAAPWTGAVAAGTGAGDTLLVDKGLAVPALADPAAAPAHWRDRALFAAPTLR